MANCGPVSDERDAASPAVANLGTPSESQPPASFGPNAPAVAYFLGQLGALDGRRALTISTGRMLAESRGFGAARDRIRAAEMPIAVSPAAEDKRERCQDHR